MLRRLEVPFRDASAGQLVWQLDAARQPALATRTVTLAGIRYELRLLGASHQVLVESDAGRPLCNELVACRPGVAGDLPAAADVSRGGVHYRFTSAVERVDARTLATRAEAVLRAADEDEAVLVGAFPGSPHAVTAIALTPGGGWRTWHVYPQSGEIVTTTTVIAVEAAEAVA